mmetsp:Transcript_13938/g.23212  ORF Transcript_13938/g.23212 Transcript_13938/m.23212 type:complete len:212 (+) Transcript_13938:28-663(+)
MLLRRRTTVAGCTFPNIYFHHRHHRPTHTCSSVHLFLQLPSTGQKGSTCITPPLEFGHHPLLSEGQPRRGHLLPLILRLSPEEFASTPHTNDAGLVIHNVLLKAKRYGLDDLPLPAKILANARPALECLPDVRGQVHAAKTVLHRRYALVVCCEVFQVLLDRRLHADRYAEGAGILEQLLSVMLGVGHIYRYYLTADKLNPIQQRQSDDDK